MAMKIAINGFGRIALLVIRAMADKGLLKKDVQELIAELRKQYDRVRQEQEFLKLKQRELRRDDEISFFGFLDAKQSLAMEQSLLSGHALMIQQDIQEGRITLDPETKRCLNDIIAYSRRLWIS